MFVGLLYTFANDFTACPHLHTSHTNHEHFTHQAQQLTVLDNHGNSHTHTGTQAVSLHGA